MEWNGMIRKDYSEKNRIEEAPYMRFTATI